MTLEGLARAIFDPSSNTPWKSMSAVTSEVPRIERGRRDGRLRAQRLGHALGAWEDDTEDSVIAECVVCEELAAVDASRGQPTEYVGRVFATRCPGPYAVR